jgi:DNA-binding response OmpR family regulator
MAAVNVMIVEDEWLIARDYISIIHGAGHTTIGPAATVASALRLLDQERVDVVLLDFQLRGETSAPVVARLNASSIPFLVVTGHAAIDLPRDFASGAMLAKPANPETLMGLLEKLSRNQS